MELIKKNNLINSKTIMEAKYSSMQIIKTLNK